MYIFLLPLVIVTLLTLPVLSRIKHFSDGKKAQRAIIGNICTFFGIMILAVALPIADGLRKWMKRLTTSGTA